MQELIQVPLVDLAAQYGDLHDEIDAAIRSVVRRGAFSSGVERDAFEAEFAKFVGVSHVVGVSSGTDAITLALLALGVGHGDEVITVPHTFIATCEAISAVGANVRFADIDPDTYTLDPDAFEAAITPRTKAVIPVHLYGQPADMDAILEIADRHGILVIEDAAQAHGASLHRRKVGTFGVAACFSFYPSKNLGAYGDAGAVATNDPCIAERVRRLSNHGQSERYQHDEIGGCKRLDNLQAAILLVKLGQLHDWNLRRRHIASLYSQQLLGLSTVITPTVRPDAEHVFHLYVIRVQNRDTLVRKMSSCGIAVGVHYPIPIHMQHAYAHLRLQPGAFPESERAAREVMSLPIYPEMEDPLVIYVGSILKGLISS